MELGWGGGHVCLGERLERRKSVLRHQVGHMSLIKSQSLMVIWLFEVRHCVAVMLTREASGGILRHELPAVWAHLHLREPTG